MKNEKPLKRKAYGSIPHLPNSRIGDGEHFISERQNRILTKETRDRHDTIIIQEKLDGSNVAIVMNGGKPLALSRAGYLATTSPYKMHHDFAKWVNENKYRFDILAEGEQISGEWMQVAHGTMYKDFDEPFFVFDVFNPKRERFLYFDLLDKLKNRFFTPHLVNYGCPISVETAIKRLGNKGFHGATEKIEGAVWRCERKGIVDFVAKFVRPDKVDGKYLTDNEEDAIIMCNLHYE